MKYLILGTILLLCTPALHAIEPHAFPGGEVFEGKEIDFDQLDRSTDFADGRYGLWVCYSIYRSFAGWGNYYGYSRNRAIAWNNARLACQLANPYDVYNCYVTGCRFR